MKFQTLLVSSFFKKNKKYLSNFVNSINDQSDQKFDILLTLDKSNYNFYLKKLKKKNRRIYLLKERLPIKLNKYNILKKIKSLKYQNIILQDSDDTCDKDRVKITKKLLLKNNFVIGDIVLNNKKVFSKYFKNNQKLTPANLLNCNIAGFGNTAFKKKILSKSKLKKFYEIPTNIRAIDWNAWLIFLNKLKNIIFCSDIKIFYRSHQLSNTNITKFDFKKFKENIEVQHETFSNVLTINKIYMLRFEYILKNYINCNRKSFNKKFKLFRSRHKRIWFYLPN